jgi:hypothetical protein
MSKGGSMTLRLLTLIAGVSAAALAFATLTSAAPTENSTSPFSITTDASCTGEPISFQGTMHVVRNTTETANGSHLHGHVNAHLDGVGLQSGAKYVGTIGVDVNVNLSAPPSQSNNFTLVSNLHIVRAGESAPSDDYSEHIVVRLTINAIGEEKAYADEFRGGCG